MRALGLAVLLALLAHTIPLSSLALELPVTEEPAAEPEETSELVPEEFPVPELDLLLDQEETLVEEDVSEELAAPEEELLMTSASPSDMLIDQSESGYDIEFAGGSGGSYRYLQPAPLYTAVGSGVAAKARLYLARNIETTEPPLGSNVFIITLNNADRSGQHVCTLLEGHQHRSITEAYSSNYANIPIGDASAVALVELDASTGDCVLEEGTTYEVRLINLVTGDPRWTNGILYTRGADASQFFLQVTATDFPPEEPEVCEECASNVLFIPGIKGSRLYVEEGEEEKLWDPIGNDDIRSLFLDADGRSLQRIYTKDGDVLDSVAGFIDFYQGFLDTLASLANNGEINNWEAVAYDWRLSLQDIVETGVEENGRIYYGEATSTPYIEQTLRSLAASSKTGKVTIVAHSNGGLVTKALLSRLGDVETSELVDKVIFVGVPQSGAPQALGALLFGYKEGLPWWFPFMVSPGVAREMAENSPMGYHLLPTQSYFDSVALDPVHAVARFNAHTLYAPERSSYGSAIDSVDELSSYLLAREGGRTKPLAERYMDANVLNGQLVDYALDMHDQIDGWHPPEDVTLYQIAGWGEDTVSGVEFYEECLSSGCKAKYRPTFIEDGDGVVPIPSALMIEEGENVERYWVDLNFVGGDHGNFLDKNVVNIFIENLINNDMQTHEHITETQPTNSGNKKLIFILHSPLTLEVRDENGNRSGPLETGKEESIAKSHYGRFGETQFVIVPASGSYTVEMRGIDDGTFSLDIQEFESGYVATTSTVANLPASQNTYAYFSISGGVENASPISVDVDGNGIEDVVLSFEANKVTEQTPSSPSENIFDRNGKSNRSGRSPEVESWSVFLEAHNYTESFKEEGVTQHTPTIFYETSKKDELIEENLSPKTNSWYKNLVEWLSDLFSYLLSILSRFI